MTHLHFSSVRAAVAAALLIAAVDGYMRPVFAQDLEQHVQLSIELLELSVTEWRERIAVPADSSAESRAAALAAIEKKFKAERSTLYERYSTSEAEQLTFFASHATEVEDYFAEHTEVKARIDELSQTLRTLIAQAESPGGPSGASR
jgi:hypothetical protein